MLELNSVSPKLAKFLWNECPILIYRLDLRDYGAYQSDKGTGNAECILIGKFRSKKLMHTALLHEVGHYKDSLKLKHRFNNRDTKTLEKTAWKHAIRFSDKYRIPMNYEVAQLWLLTYKAKYRCLDNRAEQNEMGTGKTGNRL